MYLCCKLLLWFISNFGQWRHSQWWFVNSNRWSKPSSPRPAAKIHSHTKEPSSCGLYGCCHLHKLSKIRYRLPPFPQVPHGLLQALGVHPGSPFRKSESLQMFGSFLRGTCITYYACWAKDMLWLHSDVTTPIPGPCKSDTSATVFICEYARSVQIAITHLLRPHQGIIRLSQSPYIDPCRPWPQQWDLLLPGIDD